MKDLDVQRMTTIDDSLATIHNLTSDANKDAVNALSGSIVHEVNMVFREAWMSGYDSSMKFTTDAIDISKAEHKRDYNNVVLFCGAANAVMLLLALVIGGWIGG